MKIEDGELLFMPEVADLFSKEVTAESFSDYIESQKTNYLNRYHRAISTKEIRQHGCEHCAQGQDKFLKAIHNRIENMEILFYSCLLTTELEEISDRFFDYVRETATFFSINNLARCHYRHYIADAFVIRALKINSALRQKDVEFKNIIVTEAMEQDPIGTQIDLIGLNRVLESMELQKKMAGVEDHGYSDEFLENHRNLETYALKLGPLLLQQQEKKKTSTKLPNDFSSYLIKQDNNLIRKLTALYKNARPREVCLMLFALHKLSYIKNPYTFNKTAVFDTLKNLLGNIGTRQAFNSALNRINEDFDREQINRHKQQILD